MVEVRADHDVLRAQRRIGAGDDRADVLRDGVLEWKELRIGPSALRRRVTPDAEGRSQPKLGVAAHDEGGRAIPAWRARVTPAERTAGERRDVGGGARRGGGSRVQLARGRGDEPDDDERLQGFGNRVRTDHERATADRTGSQLPRPTLTILHTKIATDSAKMTIAGAVTAPVLSCE